MNNMTIEQKEKHQILMIWKRGAFQCYIRTTIIPFYEHHYNISLTGHMYKVITTSIEQRENYSVNMSKTVSQMM